MNSCCNNLDRVSAAATSFLSVSCGNIFPYGQLLQQPWLHPPLWSVTLATMATSSPNVSSCNNPDHVSAAFTSSTMASYSNNHGHFHMRPHPPLWSVTPTTMAILSCDHILSYGQLLRQPWPCFSGDHTLHYGHAVTPTTIAIFSFGRVLP